MSEIFGYFTDVRDILRMSEIFGYFTDVREVWDIYKIPIKYRDIRGGSEPHARPDDDEPPISTYRDSRGNHGNTGCHTRPGKVCCGARGPSSNPKTVAGQSQIQEADRTGTARENGVRDLASALPAAASACVQTQVYFEAIASRVRTFSRSGVTWHRSGRCPG